MRPHFSLTFLAVVVLAACNINPALPSIISFVSTAYAVSPDERFTLTWETQNAEQVKLCHSTNWEMLCDPVPGSGSKTLTGGIAGRTPRYRLEIWSGDRKVTSRDIAITIPCQYTWDAIWKAGKPTDCPVTPYVTSPGAIQEFEHGVMLWVDNGGQIEPQDKSRKLFVFVPGTEEIISGAQGRPQPGNDVRERLGSPLGPSAEFLTAYQCFSLADKWGDFTNCYLLVHDKIYVTGSPYGNWMVWPR